MSSDVRRFFDVQATDYDRRPLGLRDFHRVVAARLERELRGEVLAVGGLWVEADPRRCDARLAVTDLSTGMLRRYRERVPRAFAADALALPVRSGSFDHVVYPLALHHMAGERVAEGRAQVDRALREAYRVLRPGGRIWISELVVGPAVYRLEEAAQGITRRLLAALDQPFVSFHTSERYVEGLREAGFEAPRMERVHVPAGRFDAITPIIAAPWLRVPRFFYPLHVALGVARKPDGATDGVAAQSA